MWRSFFRAGGAVSSLEEEVLSYQGAAASCREGAFPSERRDQEASPSEDPWEDACRGEGPSYLEAGLLCPWGAGLLVLVDTALALQRCSLLQRRRRRFLCPVESSPAVKVLPLL